MNDLTGLIFVLCNTVLIFQVIKMAGESWWCHIIWF